MNKKICDFIPENIIRGFSKKQIAIINSAIKEGKPILFTGNGPVGKTFSAHALRNVGITAYAPEEVCCIDLEEKRVTLEGLEFKGRMVKGIKHE